MLRAKEAIDMYFLVTGVLRLKKKVLTIKDSLLYVGQHVVNHQSLSRSLLPPILSPGMATLALTGSSGEPQSG